MTQLFTTLIHADWSASAEKRWATRATRTQDGWEVDALFIVPASTQFLDDLFAQAENGSVLTGFDFPIGVPSAYGLRTGAPNFGLLLPPKDRTDHPG